MHFEKAAIRGSPTTPSNKRSTGGRALQECRDDDMADMEVEFPKEKEVPMVRTNEESNHFLHRWSVDLEPGDYVVTVCQRGYDWKYEVPFMLAIWNTEDEGGLTSSPFPLPNAVYQSPQRDRSHTGAGSNRSVQKSRSGNIIRLQVLGSFKAPAEGNRDNFVSLVGT